MALKPQDVVVLLKVAMWPGGVWTFAGLAKDLGLSTSEVHSAIRRSVASELAGPRPDLGMITVNRRNLVEFLLHGVRYVFPAERGAITRGIPSGAASPVLAPHFGPSDEVPLVWPFATGAVRGQSLKPLYPSVPEAAMRDQNLYAALSLVDSIRSGRARERAVASEVLAGLLSEVA